MFLFTLLSANFSYLSKVSSPKYHQNNLLIRQKIFIAYHVKGEHYLNSIRSLAEGKEQHWDIY